MKIRPVLTEKEKRQWLIIVVTFPPGGVLALLQAMVVFQEGENLGGWASAVFGGVVLFLAGMVIFYKHLLYQVQVVFFYLIAFYLVVMTIQAVDSIFERGEHGSDAFLADLTAILLWMAIVYVASYLALSNRQNSHFMFFSLSSLTIVLLYHMIFKEGFQLFIVVLWVRSLFALFVLVMLITRIGKLHHDHATKDDLTGAYNRREVYLVLDHELKRAERYGSLFSIILFDVDHFKNINDTYGHIIGDNILKGISELTQKTIRSTDCFGRWGGEEFLLVLPGADLKEARHLAERLCEAIRQRRFETINHVTASFGVAEYWRGCDLEDILHAADQSMYQAKQDGRNRVVVYAAGK
jgi:diguanylate cyclase (GGDEF)-like protein